MLTTLMTRRDLFLAAAAATATLKQGKLEEAFSKLEAAAQSGAAEGSVLLVQQGDSTMVKAFGTARDRKPVFLLASITKPMTATGVMVLADRGQLKLTDPVQRYIPEFRGDGREEVLIRHLLTHTSGLPDMVPENTELRKRHAPLKDFVAATCKTPLLFKPGSQVRYQSMGILLAEEIATRITKQPFSDFLRDQLFKPLQMKDTSLGLGGRPIASTMHCQVDQVTDYDWNSPYWRNLGSPWGGALATAEDVAKFVRYFANPQQAKVLRPETAAAMITSQTGDLKPSYGLGWKLDSPARWGHSGSTGTLCWHDKSRDLTFVLLTTRPAEHSSKTLIEPVSKIVSSAA